MIKTSKVHSRFVPSVGYNKQYTFVFTIDENGKTTALHCDERNISNTFKCSQRFQFADKKEVNSAWHHTMELLMKNIKVDGIGVVDVITYIEEELVELPF